MELSIIVATWKRPQLLALCLSQIQAQSSAVDFETIVVSDGRDPIAGLIAKEYDARQFIELSRNHNDWGASCNDAGLAVASGNYVCFWNDDNMYHRFATEELLDTAYEHDIGVCQVRLRHENFRTIPLPVAWKGSFVRGEIDLMNVCVFREFAQKEKFATAVRSYAQDHRWLKKLEKHKPKINFSECVIGDHL